MFSSVASSVIAEGDARLPRTYQALMNGAKADACVTDPPYCLLTRRRKGGDLRGLKPRQRKLDHDIVVRYESVREYAAFSEHWLAAAVPHLKPHAPMIVWTNQLGKASIAHVAGKLGYTHLAGEFIWAKHSSDAAARKHANAVDSSRPQDPPDAAARPAGVASSSSELLLRVYEIALVLTRQPLPPPSISDPPIPWSVVTGYHDDAATEFMLRESGARDNVNQILDHPHRKPLAALRPLIQSWTKPGDLILDPFSGTGAISAAAVSLGRNAVGIELVGANR